MSVWVTGGTTHPVLGRSLFLTHSPCDVLVAPGVPRLPTRLLPRALLSLFLCSNTYPQLSFLQLLFPLGVNERFTKPQFSFLDPKEHRSRGCFLKVRGFQRLYRRTLSHGEGAPQTQLKDRKVEKHFKCHSPPPSFFSSLKLSWASTLSRECLVPSWALETPNSTSGSLKTGRQAFLQWRVDSYYHRKSVTWKSFSLEKLVKAVGLPSRTLSLYPWNGTMGSSLKHCFSFS